MEMTYERAAEILDPDHREAYDSHRTCHHGLQDGNGSSQKADSGKGEFVGKLTIWKLPVLQRSCL